MIRQT